MYGASDAPKMPARLNVSELPVYRTDVGNSSDRNVPSGPYVSPISDSPIVVAAIAPPVPAENVGPNPMPNSAMPAVTQSKVRRRPTRSASQAETGIVNAQ